MMKNKLFAKYIKEKREDDHAKLSASGSERWLGCPGCINECERQGAKSVDNEASIRGTNTHTLLQVILDNIDWRRMLATKDGVAFKKLIAWDEEMEKCALMAANWVLAEKARMERKSGSPVQMLVEQKVHLDGVGYGTSDVILYQPFGLLHVIDYKNGKKAVEPENNTQGAYYGHAAADLFNWEFTDLAITIIQPNASNRRGPIRTWKASMDDLEKMGLRLKRGAIATRKPNAPLVKNDAWCFFCPARQRCPLHVERRTEKLLERFKAGA